MKKQKCDVGCWHLADKLGAATFIRYWDNSGRSPLVEPHLRNPLTGK